MAAKRRSSRTKWLILSAVCGLILCGAVTVYRYLDSVDWWLPRVDARALQARVEREQPVGGSEADTVAFLRRLGFENRYNLIERAGASNVHPGRLSAIEGWIPQPRCCLQPNQIRAFCTFEADERLNHCTISGRGAPLEVDAPSDLYTKATPVPAP